MCRADRQGSGDSDLADFCSVTVSVACLPVQAETKVKRKHDVLYENGCSATEEQPKGPESQNGGEEERMAKSQRDAAKRCTLAMGEWQEIPVIFHLTFPGRPATSSSSICRCRIQASVPGQHRPVLCIYLSLDSSVSLHSNVNTSRRRDFSKTPLAHSGTVDLTVYLQSRPSDDYSDKLE